MNEAHWADRLYGALRAGPRLFAGGWGRVEEEAEKLRGLLASGPVPLEVALGPAQRLGGCTLRHGTFHAPDPALPR